MKRPGKKAARKPAKKVARRRKAAGRRGLMFVLSSPSGAGKTTLTRLLIERDPDVRLSVSVTMRPRRPSEVEGVHYRFVNRRRFEKMRDAGELLEWAEVHGNLYGTPRAPVEKALRAGKDVLFDIDWQGTLQLYDKARSDVVSVFILPPSIAELRTRLARRAEDDERTIRSRLKNAIDEIGHWKEYDYVLVNKDLDKSFSQVKAVLAAERRKRARAAAGHGKQRIDPTEPLRRKNQAHLGDFIRRLQAEV